ncbi:MAG: hypothetical protein M3220_03995, partial [Chloroflexota bacterium]|nr:hypothetical protein [Chloroflexota bacterium]
DQWSNSIPPKVLTMLDSSASSDSEMSKVIRAKLVAMMEAVISGEKAASESINKALESQELMDKIQLQTLPSVEKK